MSDTQTRKTGDALILSGALAADILPADIDWVGATAELHIVDSTTLAVERTEACTLTAPVGETPPRYSYVGDPIAEGVYLYEIQIVFVGLADPLTFPNDKTKFKLKVVPELA